MEHSLSALNHEMIKENDHDPFVIFKKIYEEAGKVSGNLGQHIFNHEAFFLSTEGLNECPQGRILLFKNIYHQNALAFFTNYDSPKGQELKKRPLASMNFYYHPLNIQVRFSGTILKAPSQISDEYWNDRPLESQISALISPQGQKIVRKQLEEKRLEIIEQIKNEQDLDNDIFVISRGPNGKNQIKLKRPANWGGFTLTPQTIEFWFAGLNRFHHRILFEKSQNPSHQSENWTKSELAP
jgi:pyridoxamine 5'-phosphate oxidase